MGIGCTGRFKNGIPHRHQRDCLPHLFLSGVTATVCAYESVALASGWFPSVTIFCGRHRMAAVGVVLTLSVHFWRAPPVPVK